jgi:lipoprotein-anchoring transpeptidase ErfK/SrfK
MPIALVRSLGLGLVSLALTTFPAAADLLIIVDKSAQTMSVLVDGVPRYSWQVSTGRAGYDTPDGFFTPFRMERDYFSKEWDDAPMPHAIFFTPEGHAIHGSYDTRRLGSPVSHGCIRIAPANAATLFGRVAAEGLGHTKVVVTGDTPVVAGADRPPSFQPRFAQPSEGPWFGGPINAR